MGNTIRRKPIVNNIPASPDYKFLNITDFRGLEQSDNPFSTKTNTCSDMLNLYVDESNTLTTRPRLEQRIDFRDDHATLHEILDIKPLSFGYIIKYTEGGTAAHNYRDVTYAIDVVEYSGNTYVTYHVIDGDIAKGDKLYSVFEQDNKIYFIDGSGYYNISKTNSQYTCSKVVGYIPTVRVGGTNLQQGAFNEDYNILASRYKEAYRWDGTWNPYSLLDKSTDTLENDYLSTIPYTSWSMAAGCNIVKVLSASKDDWKKDTLDNISVLAYSKQSGNKSYIYSQRNGTITSREIVCTETLPDTFNYVIPDASSDGKYVAEYFVSQSASSTSTTGGIYVLRDTKWYSVSVSKTYWCNILDNTNIIKISEDGNTIVALVNKTLTDKTLMVAKYNKDTDKYDTFYYDLSTKLKGSVSTFNDTGARLFLIDNKVVLSVGDSEGAYFIYTNISGDLETRDLTFLVSGNYEAGSDIDKVTVNSNASMVFVGGYTLKKYTIDVNTIIEKDLPTETKNNLIFNKDVVFSVDSDDLVYMTFSTKPKDGYLILSTNTFVELNTKLFTVNMNALYFSGKGIIGCSANTHVCKTTIDLSSLEPLLVIERDVDDENVLANVNSLKKAKLSIRFDNERFFAHDNKVFITKNNNPTYIPKYQTVGDQKDIFTGFNIISDNILAIYKETSIIVVTAQTTTDLNGVSEKVYNYKETKNVVGNNAFNSTIVTVYSELPLQITHDGIYVLQQLKNTYQTDRVAQCISKNMDKKWSENDKNIVDIAMTANRQYWTYIVLPYEKLKMTKVFLLDNRTLTWFYWELPIVALSVFNKDDKIYFADMNCLYSMETSDIINKYNPDTTEYYDLDKEIISWYWQSQILPLGTINYAKKLIDTTFIVTDTDESDEFALDYKFKAYRKLVSETNVTTLGNRLNYVQSTTKKTLIPRFKFVQVILSNVPDDLNNNKLRLVGLGLKFVLLEGLL